MQRLSRAPTECSTTFLEAVQSLMPHWTPTQGDNVVYATIEEALSGSIGNIESYLCKIKRDLHIGQPGSLGRVVIACDQLTYALMKKLNRQYSDHYKLMIVLHGDWHTLQLLAEVIRDM